MLSFGWFVRSARFVGFGLAVAASVATTDPRSSVQGELAIVLETPPPGTTVVRRFEFEVRGHPAFVDDSSYTIELELDPSTPSDFAESVAIVGFDDPIECSYSPDAGVSGRTECYGGAGSIRPACPTGTPCVVSFAIESFDSTMLGGLADARLRIIAQFGRRDPPPGEIIVREVTP